MSRKLITVFILVTSFHFFDYLTTDYLWRNRLGYEMNPITLMFIENLYLYGLITLPFVLLPLFVINKIENKWKKERVVSLSCNVSYILLLFTRFYPVLNNLLIILGMGGLPLPSFIQELWFFIYNIIKG